MRDYAIVSVKVPEGVTIEGYGKTIKGPSSVTMTVVKAKMDATPDTTPAESWNTMGGWGGKSNSLPALFLTMRQIEVVAAGYASLTRPTILNEEKSEC